MEVDLSQKRTKLSMKDIAGPSVLNSVFFLSLILFYPMELQCGVIINFTQMYHQEFLLK